jgi:WD40 repeat protein
MMDAAARHAPADTAGQDDPRQALAALIVLRQVRQEIAGWETGLIEAARDNVNAVATAILDDRRMVVSASSDGCVVVWHPATGERHGEPIAGWDGGLLAIAVTELNGRPVAVCGGMDKALRVWDLAGGEQVGEPLAGHGGWVHAVVTTRLDGQPVAITGGMDATTRLWDLETGQQLDHGHALPHLVCSARARSRGQPAGRLRPRGSGRSTTGSGRAVSATDRCRWGRTTAPVPPKSRTTLSTCPLTERSPVWRPDLERLDWMSDDQWSVALRRAARAASSSTVSHESRPAPVIRASTLWGASASIMIV